MSHQASQNLVGFDQNIRKGDLYQQTSRTLKHHSESDNRLHDTTLHEAKEVLEALVHNIYQ